VEQSLTPEDGRPVGDAGPARVFAGFSFFYALLVTVLLLTLKNFFRDEPDTDAMLLWLLVPVLGSFGAWMSVRSGFPPLRVWIWLGIVLNLFFCWIAVFSFGLLYLPVPLLMMVAVLSPWDDRSRG
jgi:hypothetical protein